MKVNHNKKTYLLFMIFELTLTNGTTTLKNVTFSSRKSFDK